jgi:phosphatidylethanolamine-binding protein (PEBP) family uncharacterized protein
MTHTFTKVALLSLVTAAGSICDAHPGGHHHEGTASSSRTWTFAESGAHMHGSFVSAKDGKAQIRRDDGRLVTLAIQQLTGEDQRWLVAKQDGIRKLNDQPPADKFRVFAPDMKAAEPAEQMAKAFEPFAKLKAVTYRSDDRFFYVESSGMPDHPMMIGITAWQQQVPLPQKYVGNNAWQIPLHPVAAKEPMSAKSHFFRGAIAIAVNGIPIFNPIKNDGRTDTLLAGELDEYGGHCGRADDYHYHIAPVHLEKQVGHGAVIAYALDGYPIYGYDEADGSKAKGLDWLNGHKDADGHYHYHATKTYPYLNGGFYGEVVEREGQVDPQPWAKGVREALPPLRGAKIVGFTSTKPNSYQLTYDISGRKGYVNYAIAENGAAAFQFIDPTGKRTEETYEPGRRPPPGVGKASDDRQPKANGNEPSGGGKAKGKGDEGPQGKGKRPPDDQKANATRASNSSVTARLRSSLPQLTVKSDAIDAQGFLSVEYTCDGESASPPVEWEAAPNGTKSFALSLWHTAPDQEKSYWVVYNVPPDVTKVPKNSTAIGRIGSNGKSRTEYDPMCSKGPGVKTYHLTVFALSEELILAPAQATRASLLAAIKDITLAEGTLDFQYERKAAK